jgi:hypothetical protein
MLAASGPDITGTLRSSILVSVHCMAVHEGEDLIALFGIAVPTLLSDQGIPWLLGSDRLSRRGCSLIKVARRYLEWVTRAYPVLVNFVDARNGASIRLIERLGFTLGEPEPFGRAGLAFRRFELRSD